MKLLTLNRHGSVVKTVALMMACIFAFTACSGDSTTRDDEGEIVEGGDINVFQVQEGDCINLAGLDEVSSFEGVACDAPHDGEIYELFDITGFDDYPVMRSSANRPTRPVSTPSSHSSVSSTHSRRTSSNSSYRTKRHGTRTTTVRSSASWSRQQESRN